MDNDKYFKILYAAFAVAFVLQFAPYMWFLAMLATIAILVVIYKKRAAVAGSIYESHANWLIRTFWIGTGVILPIILVAVSVAFYLGVDLKPLIGILQSGAEATEQVIMDTVMEPNAGYLNTLAMVSFGSMAGWWLWRCWTGFKYLLAGEPVPFVKRFWY